MENHKVPQSSSSSLAAFNHNTTPELHKWHGGPEKRQASLEKLTREIQKTMALLRVRRREKTNTFLILF